MPRNAEPTLPPRDLIATPVPGLSAPVWQARRGYRFGPENLLLPDLLALPSAPCDPESNAPPGGPHSAPAFVPSTAPASPPSTAHASAHSTASFPAPTTALDLGAGCGILGLLVHAAYPTCRVTLVERQPDHVALCRRNAASLPHVDVLDADLRDAPLPAADLIVANPPYFRPDEGQPSRHEATRHATHAHFGAVDAFAAAIARALAPTGHAWLVYPADRVAAAITAFTQHELHVTTLVWVHARHRGPEATPYRAWIHATRSPSPLQTLSLTTNTPR